MSSNTRKRNGEESSPKKSLSPEGVSPEELKSVTKTDIKGLEKYINKSFVFLRDTSKVKTGENRDEIDTKKAAEIKDKNTKLLLKHPELKKNTKFMAMIKGTNTRTFGGKSKKTYKNNKKYRKRHTVKRKFM